MRSRAYQRCSCFAVALLIHAAASAATVTYHFSGTILDNASNAFTGPGFPGIAEGHVFTGKIVFDTAVVDSEPLETVGRFFLMAPPATLVQMTVNGLTFTSATSSNPIITTNNNIFNRDSFALVAHGLFDMPPGWSASGTPLIYTSSFGAADFSQTAFDSDAIPELLRLSDFQQQNESVNVRFTIQTSTSGTVTLNHPGGTIVYTNSVDLIGDIQSLYLEGASLPGDFNLNGIVDAADYVVWRNSINTPAEYETWRSNFGNSAGSGVSSASGWNSAINVPETSTHIGLSAILLSLPIWHSYRRTDFYQRVYR
jgi:hypothetical protein